MPLDGQVDLAELARTTFGFVGADLAALAREAAIEAVRHIMPRLNLEEGTIPPEVLDELRVTRENFLDALKRVQPSAMREVMVQVPNVSWDDIGGLDEDRMRLRDRKRVVWGKSVSVLVALGGRCIVKKTTQKNT